MRDPVEVVAVSVELLAEVVAICLFIGMIAVWAAIGSGA